MSPESKFEAAKVPKSGVKVVLENTTLSGNGSAEGGGGIKLGPGINLTMTDSSISGNLGPGVYVNHDAQIDMTRSKIDQNLAGGIVAKQMSTTDEHVKAVSSWTRSEKLALWAVVVAVLAILAAFVVPEVRLAFGLKGD